MSMVAILCKSPPMAKAYSLASWNVEHFRNPDSRVDRIVDFLVNLGPPDLFALYEVEGKEVFTALVSKMPGYTFHITEGPQVQEIMLGVKSSLTAFFTQKTEFKSGLWALRPGALLTLTIAGEQYPILVLHTKSGVEPLGLGLRDDMLNWTATWWGGPNTLIPPSNLDQVVAADHLQFKGMNGADVTVLGWPKEVSSSAQGEWIKDYSDHGCFYFEVQKVSS